MRVGTYSRLIEIQRLLSQAKQKLDLVLAAGGTEICPELPAAEPKLRHVISVVEDAKCTAKEALNQLAGGKPA